jgi:hypothetical protein
MIGGTVGAQIQQGFVVLGIEGDLDWANVEGNGISTPTILGVPQPITLNIASNISAGKFDRSGRTLEFSKHRRTHDRKASTPRSRSSRKLPIPIRVSEATILAFGSSIARATPASTHFKTLS